MTQFILEGLIMFFEREYSSFLLSSNEIKSYVNKILPVKWN